MRWVISCPKFLVDTVPHVGADPDKRLSPHRDLVSDRPSEVPSVYSDMLLGDLLPLLTDVLEEHLHFVISQLPLQQLLVYDEVVPCSFSTCHGVT